LLKSNYIISGDQIILIFEQNRVDQGACGIVHLDWHLPNLLTDLPSPVRQIVFLLIAAGTYPRQLFFAESCSSKDFFT
jgi:hypothetical protein